MEPFIGQIMMFGGNFAPRGWAMCDGQLLPISQYSALFSILGTMYGGDGRTTFALPDLRGRAPIGMGNGPGLSDVREGQKGGRETVTLTVNEMPSHNHSANTANLKSVAPGHTGPGDTDTPGPTAMPANAVGQLIYSNAPADTTMAQGTVTGSVSIGNTGGNQPTDIRNPFIGMNYIIALQGIFPSRS